MVSHYTIQTKDHKITLKELDLTCMEMKFIKDALEHYYLALEGNYERLVLDEKLPEAAVTLLDVSISVKEIRKKLDGRD